MTTTSERLRAIMDRHGWDRKDTAAVFDVSPETIQNWLSGRIMRGPAKRLLEHFEKLEVKQ